MIRKKADEPEIGYPGEIDNISPSLTNTVKLSDLLGLCVKYWYWILFFLLICLGFAWVSIKRTVPLYSQSMTVLLRDNVEGNGAGSASIQLGDLGLTQSYTVLEDEMEALRSPDLMAQVVVALNLTTSYEAPGSLHPYPLYGSNLPVIVSFPDIQPEEKASLSLEIDEDGNITVTSLDINKYDCELTDGGKMNFGDALNTPVGTITVQKTPFYKEGKAYKINVKHSPLTVTTQNYVTKLTIDNPSSKKSNVININLIDNSIERADDVLSMLMECYTQNWIKAKAEVVAQTDEFIQQRLVAVENELAGVDSNISDYKSQNLITDMDQTSRVFLQKSSEMDTQLLNANNQLQMAQYLKNFILTENKYTPLPVNTGIANTNIENQVNIYNNLVMQRNAYLVNSSESNPLVVDLDARLASLRTSVIQSIDNIIVSLSTSINNMERKERSNISKVAASPEQAKYLLSEQRRQKVQENLYLYLLQKREENELSRAYVNINTRILRQPSGNKSPIAPRKAQTMAIALVLGLVVPVGTLYLLELSNTKLRGKKDLEGMNVPIAGEVPRVMKKGGKSLVPSRFRKKLRRENDTSDIVVQDGNRDGVNEAIRVLRSNITRMTGDALPSVIMLTSFNPGSGKTFITINLGLSMALKGHKVLLIDGDMRRASLSGYVGSPHKGYSEYLTGSIKDINSVIHKNFETQGLDILPVGYLPPNPTELLENQRFKEMIEELRSEYEYILIDCPPSEMMADAQIIAEVSDRTIMVLRVGLFQRGMLTEVEKIYNEKKYPAVSLVLNDTIIEGGKYGSYYTYGYGKKTK